MYELAFLSFSMRKPGRILSLVTDICLKTEKKTAENVIITVIEGLYFNYFGSKRDFRVIFLIKKQCEHCA